MRAHQVLLIKRKYHTGCIRKMDIDVNVHFLLSGVQLLYFENSVNPVAEKLCYLSVQHCEDE